MPSPQANALPEGMHSLTPHIVCADAAAAIEYYKAALNAVELGRVHGPDGKLAHASLKIGDSHLFLVDEMPQCGTFGPQPGSTATVFLHLFVENADATLAQAAASGGQVTLQPFDAPWGDRYGQFRDPFGHVWSVAHHVRDVKPEEVEQAFRAMAGGACEAVA